MPGRAGEGGGKRQVPGCGCLFFYRAENIISAHSLVLKSKKIKPSLTG